MELCFDVWGNLAPFSKRWCTFLKDYIPDSYTCYKHSLQRMPWSRKNTMVYIYMYIYVYICIYICIYVYIYIYVDLNLKCCWNLLAEGAILLWNCIRIEGLFQTITALFSKILHFFKGNAQSQATLSVRNITFFEK